MITSTASRSVVERLRDLLNVIPYPGVSVSVDADTYQLLVDLHAHFAACEALIENGDVPCPCNNAAGT